MKEQLIKSAIETNGTVYVSITGLLCHSIFTVPWFWYHAISSKIQADKAEGVLFVDVKTLNSYHHTLTVWENKQKMLAYLRAGAHKEAMKNFRSIGTGKVHGYEASTFTDTTWDEAMKRYNEKARSIGGGQQQVQEDTNTAK